MIFKSRKIPGKPSCHSFFPSSIKTTATITSASAAAEELYSPSPPSLDEKHRSYCFALVDNLIRRRRHPDAQGVVDRIISKSSSLPDALSALEFATARGIEFDPSSYGSLLRTLVSSGWTDIAEQLHAVRRGGFFPSKDAYDALISMLYRERRLLEAVDIFFNMVEEGVFPRPSSFNLLIKGLSCNGYLEEAREVFLRMIQSGIRPTLQLYKSLFYNLCKRRRVEEAAILCNEMELNGFFPGRVMYTSLICGYCKEGRVGLKMPSFWLVL